MRSSKKFYRGRGFDCLLHYLFLHFIIFIGTQLLRVEEDKAHYVCPVYTLYMRIHHV